MSSSIFRNKNAEWLARKNQTFVERVDQQIAKRVPFEEMFVLNKTRVARYIASRMRKEGCDVEDKVIITIIGDFVRILYDDLKDGSIVRLPIASVRIHKEHFRIFLNKNLKKFILNNIEK